MVAVPYQVYRLTHSSLDVGLVSLAQLGPLLVCSLIGGAVADAHDRRRLLLVTELLLAVVSAGLAINGGLAHPARGPSLSCRPRPADWPASTVRPSTPPSRGWCRPVICRRLTPCGRCRLQVGTVVGPALAGVILSSAGLAAVYWLDVASFVVSFGSVLALGPLPPRDGATRAGWRSVAEGLAYLRGRQVIQGVYLLDIDAMVFGMPRALFPALGIGFFHGGAREVGFLFAAPGAGALVGALTTGWVSGIRRQGRAVIVAVVIWGTAITVFGLVDVLWIALALLALAGWADVVSAVFRNTILQTVVPDRAARQIVRGADRGGAGRTAARRSGGGGRGPGARDVFFRGIRRAGLRDRGPAVGRGPARFPCAEDGARDLGPRLRAWATRQQGRINVASCLGSVSPHARQADC